MSSATANQYQCLKCSSIRIADINAEYHLENISQSSNGLVIYSDIHRCENGILGINNIHVDHDYHIRSSEQIVLPSKRIAVSSTLLNIPTPKINSGDMKNVMIREFQPNKDFRLIIADQGLKIIINIGDVNDNKEKPISTLYSDHGTICLAFYPSGLPYTNFIEQWMVTFINLLETLPPTRIGLFIETLRYIHDMHKIGPALFHIEILKMILSSHEIHFEPVKIPIEFDSLLSEGRDFYGSEAVTLMVKILSYLELNPHVPLLYYTKTHHEDIGYLIYLFLTLEQENLIKIIKPTF